MHTDDGTHDTAPTAKTVCGWVKAFHSSGLLVTLPVTETPTDYAAMFANVSAALAAGFTASMPGMEPGEEKEEIGWVLKRTKTNNDKSESPIIDLYSTHDKVTFKVFSKYLDSAEEIAAFEAASGLRVSALQNFPGTAAPQRGANKQSDAFILKVPKPFSVVMEPNPKWNEADADAARAANKAYPVPKKRFVRWDKPAGATEPREPDARPQAADGDEFDYLLAGLQQARDLGALGAALGEVNKAATANRLTGTQRARLIEAKETRKRELADAPATSAQDEELIPF